MAMQKRERGRGKKDGFLRNSKANIAGSIIDLPLRDYPCIVSVCRSSVSSSRRRRHLPHSPHPPRDYAVETGAKEGGERGVGGHIQWLTSSSHMVKPTEDLISLYVDVCAE